jgi:hypothetical protein
MTQEPNKQEPPSPEPLPQEKLLIDDASNFQFHAAYMVYAELFDNTTEANVRSELNKNIKDLKENQIGCETFYRNIAHFRKVAPLQRQDKAMFQTQRKKDWRVKSQRQERIKRHKK